MEAHAPVLFAELIERLSVRPDGTYLDATFGRGGHSKAILDRLGRAGRLFAMDRDPDAVAAALPLVARDSRLVVEQENFGRLKTFAEKYGVFGELDGIVIDLGVSSPQLDTPERGFSFRTDGPLDMRMNPAEGQSAADWLNNAPGAEIARVIRRFGEEPRAGAIARAIVARREDQPLRTTGELAALIETIIRRRPGDRHPATRCFQAIRMFVNRELEELEAALPQAVDALAPGGRLCVISFHSLEDRRVKRFMRDQSRVDPALAKLPEIPASARPRLRLVSRAIRPGGEELADNPRARSAVLRAAERVA